MLKKIIKKPVIVVNGDIYKTQFLDFMNFHIQSNSKVTMVKINEYKNLRCVDINKFGDIKNS